MPSVFSRSEPDTDDEELPTNDNVFVIYSNKSCVTGRNIARYLGANHGKRQNDGRRYDYLIRWGSSRGVEYIPSEETINLQRAINGNTNKLDALRTLEEAGIPTPAFSTNPSDLDYPILGRASNHTQGSDINLILQERDVELTENDFYVEYIPTELEYRLHVMNGDVFLVREKRKRNGEDNHPYIRNYETGWVLLEPRAEHPEHEIAANALEALDLDFGAVDLVRGEDGREYVLEVNTAPSLNENNLPRYGERLAERVGLDEWPGMDHPEIEFPQHEEDEEEE